MDDQLKKLHTPPRNKERQEESLSQIKKKIQRRTHFRKGQYYITLISSAAVIFLVIISLFNPAQNFTVTSASGTKLEKVYKFYNQSSEPIYEIDKWYYTEKYKLIEKEDLAFFEAMSFEVKNSNNLNSSEWPAAMNDYLLVFENGTKQYLQYWSTYTDAGEFTFVLDPVTNQVYNTSHDQNEQFYEYNNNRRPIVLNLFTLAGLGVLIMIIFKIFQRHKLLGETTIQKMNKRPFIKGILLFVYYTVVRAISLVIFGTIHGMFVFALLMIPFIVNSWRNYGKSNYNTSLWTLPFMALIILYVVFIMKIFN